jgi:putative phosphoribosyl transferase
MQFIVRNLCRYAQDARQRRVARDVLRDGTIDASDTITMTPIQHILVATDFGAASVRALEVAADIASRFGAKMTVLHAIEDLSYVSPCSVPPEIRKSAAFRLDDTLKFVCRQVPTAKGIVREGFAWHEIVEVAKQVGADLVVVGSHGHGADRRFLIGSVAEKVVRVCAAPVLTVHGWRFEDRTQAGIELAEVLLRSDEQAPTVVALSRGGAIVGAQIAQAFGVPLMALLTRELERDGQVLGAVCEDGTVHLDERVEPTASARELADAERASAELCEEARHFRSPFVEDGKTGTIVLVSDAILTAAPTIMAAQILRRRTSRRIMAAAPLACMAAREALSKVIDGVVVVQMVEDRAPLGHLYRDLSGPNDRAVIDGLAGAAQWAQAVAGVDGLAGAAQGAQPVERRP